MTPVLVLGGTAEARALAGELATLPGARPILSLAGITRHPVPSKVETRSGGFGGIDGLRRWLEIHTPAAVIDATHPFATTMQDNAIAACRQAEVPHLRLLRPPWPNRPSWFLMPDHDAAARHLSPGARVLLTTGRKNLAPFAARTDVIFALRTIEAVQGLPDNILPMTARPPFTDEAERGLMERLELTHLITKNAGGAQVAKLNAAEALRLTTLVIARPPLPNAEITDTVEDAVVWLRRTVAMRR